MEIIDKDRFNFLWRKKEIEFSNFSFIDDLRIGLRVKRKVILAPDEIDGLADPREKAWKKIDLKQSKLKKHNFYLGQSIEKLKLPNNIFGIIHTRSIFARIGLDVIQSSFYVAPGFGSTRKLPIVLELYPKISIKLDHEIPIAGLMLFELKRPVGIANIDFGNLFPLNYKS